jgi:hypothetical protein
MVHHVARAVDLTRALSHGPTPDVSTKHARPIPIRRPWPLASACSAERRGPNVVGHLLQLHEVAAPQLGAIEVQLPRGEVENALAHEVALVSPRTAIVPAGVLFVSTQSTSAR